MNCSCALCEARLSAGLWSTVAVRVPGEGTGVRVVQQWVWLYSYNIIQYMTIHCTSSLCGCIYFITQSHMYKPLYHWLLDHIAFRMYIPLPSSSSTSPPLFPPPFVFPFFLSLLLYLPLLPFPSSSFPLPPFFSPSSCGFHGHLLHCPPIHGHTEDHISEGGSRYYNRMSKQEVTKLYCYH